MSIESRNILPKEVQDQIDAGYELIDVVSHEGKYGLIDYDPTDFCWICVGSFVYVLEKKSRPQHPPATPLPASRFAFLTMSVLVH